ncbi:MAG: hypothetical protein GY866_37520 [Proteobacteria bacterium]|nr:hypothetical protein [Pseudomonadota bacterium]
MSKKNLVKKIIDELIEQGKDFTELTQGSLAMVEELEGVSRTTIKRAKKEYKLEKIVVQDDYKEKSIKNKIYKYLSKHPKSSLSDLRDALPNISPFKVSEYHLFWKKKQEKLLNKNKEKKPVISPRKLKEMIFKHLDENDDATTEQLYSAFQDANRSSISSYHGHWKKKQSNNDTGKRGGLFQVLFDYLDRFPQSTVDDLQKAFTDVPRRSIEIYHNLWSKKQEEKEDESDAIVKVVQEFIIPAKEQEELEAGKPDKKPADGKSSPNRKEKKTVSNRIQPADENVPARAVGKEILDQDDKRIEKSPKLDTRAGWQADTRPEAGDRDDQELIVTLKNTIEAQKTTIAALDAEYSLLKENQPDVVSMVREMNSDERSEIRRFLRTYLNGLKST